MPTFCKAIDEPVVSMQDHVTHEDSKGSGNNRLMMAFLPYGNFDEGTCRRIASTGWLPGIDITAYEQQESISIIERLEKGGYPYAIRVDEGHLGTLQDTKNLEVVISTSQVSDRIPENLTVRCFENRPGFVVAVSLLTGARIEMDMLAEKIHTLIIGHPPGMNADIHTHPGRAPDCLLQERDVRFVGVESEEAVRSGFG